MKQFLRGCFALPLLFAGLCGTAHADAISTLQATLKALQATVGTLQTRVAALQATNNFQSSQLNSLSIANNRLTSQVAALAGNVGTINSNTVLGLNGKLRLDGTAAVFTGVDVQITNGSGSTTGATPAGLGGGNLIIGYNESDPNAPPACSDGSRGHIVPANCGAPAVWGPSQHSGYHNLVIGYGHSYTSYGGMVVGAYNVINNAYASVSGGGGNFASGMYSSVSSGVNNSADGYGSSVSGGDANTASGELSSVTGGVYNTAVGYESTVSGGYENKANAINSSVSGGMRNSAGAWASSVSGGYAIDNSVEFGWSAGNLKTP
jgi:hypothetical protein